MSRTASRSSGVTSPNVSVVSAMRRLYGAVGGRGRCRTSSVLTGGVFRHIRQDDGVREGGHMPQTVQGVVAREKGAPVTLEEIVVPDPGPGEALVRVEACGVCHTDLDYREGGINDDFPFLLGHEAAGTVEAVGD